MTEQVPVEELAEPLRRTAFGRVLCELVEKRGIPATPGDIGPLAEKAGLNGWKVLNRMASTRNRYVGRDLGLLADELQLSKEERRRLTRALAHEEE